MIILNKITKQDINDNFYYFKTIIIFTILLAIVYGYMTFILVGKNASAPAYLKWILGLLVGCIILIAGTIVEILFLKHKKKENKEIK